MASPPPVVNHYRNYRPTFDLAPTVEILLRYVPEEHLAGLKYVELTNSTSSRMLRRGKTWSRRKKVQMANCLGFYCGDHIKILVENLLQSVPPLFVRIPLTRAVLVGMVLYHEIGHHIHSVHRPAYKEKEDVADQWMKVLLRQFLIRRYWYLTPARKPIGFALRAYGRWKYGMAEFKIGSRG